jgi:hypothetical protein
MLEVIVPAVVLVLLAAVVTLFIAAGWIKWRR